jgi:hypothetical protein
MTIGMFGAIAGPSPSFCPRCGTRVDITSQGTITPHNARVAGPSCDGAGLPATAVPPWPGTIKPAASHKRFRVQRLGRRLGGRHTAAQ